MLDHLRRTPAVALVALAVLVHVTSANAGDAPAKAAKTAGSASRVEPKAVALLEAMSAKLASAKSLTFDAVSTYESPSLYGAPLVYKTISQVSLQRPDKLKVVTVADGPASEFYYDGKTMTAFAVTENLAAIADAPASVDAALEELYRKSGTYFPFADYLVADPYKDISKNLTLAFYIGQSRVVGGITTDMVAYESEGVFIQLWIGADDKLPRMARAVYFDDPQKLRHEIELSNWKLDVALEPAHFQSAKAAAAEKIEFSHPKVHQAPAAARPAAKTAAEPATKAP